MCMPVLRSDFKSQIWPLGFISNLSGDLALNWISWARAHHIRHNMRSKSIISSDVLQINIPAQLQLDYNKAVNTANNTTIKKRKKKQNKTAKSPALPCWVFWKSFDRHHRHGGCCHYSIDLRWDAGHLQSWGGLWQTPAWIQKNTTKIKQFIRRCVNLSLRVFLKINCCLFWFCFTRERESELVFLFFLLCVSLTLKFICVWGPPQSPWYSQCHVVVVVVVVVVDWWWFRFLGGLWSRATAIFRVLLLRLFHQVALLLLLAQRRACCDARHFSPVSSNRETFQFFLPSATTGRNVLLILHLPAPIYFRCKPSCTRTEFCTSRRPKKNTHTHTHTKGVKHGQPPEFFSSGQGGGVERRMVVQ